MANLVLFLYQQLYMYIVHTLNVYMLCIILYISACIIYIYIYIYIYTHTYIYIHLYIHELTIYAMCYVYILQVTCIYVSIWVYISCILYMLYIYTVYLIIPRSRNSLYTNYSCFHFSSSGSDYISIDLE